MRYNSPSSPRVSVGGLYKLDNCSVRFYNVFPIRGGELYNLYNRSDSWSFFAKSTYSAIHFFPIQKLIAEKSDLVKFPEVTFFRKVSFSSFQVFINSAMLYLTQMYKSW